KGDTPLTSATLVFAGKLDDLAINCVHDATPGFERDFVQREIQNFKSETYLLGRNGSSTLVDVPIDAESDVQREWLTVQTRTPWSVGGKTYGAGELLVARLDDWLLGKRDLTVLFEPTETVSLSSYNWARHHLILNELEDVVSRVEVLTFADGTW